MKDRLIINSDFKDYYDEFECDNSTEYRDIEYDRKMSNQLNIARSLKFIQSAGYEVAECNQVKNLFNCEDVMVYIGKDRQTKRMSLAEAKNRYPNELAVNYYNTDKFIKIICIGTIYIRIICDIDSEGNKKITRIEKSIGDYDDKIKNPIYSYSQIVNSNGELIVAEYNSVENLGRTGFNKIISKETVQSEVIRAIKHYERWRYI